MPKVYPQKIEGKYRKIKNYASFVLLLFYFLTPWIRWNRAVNLPDQAILIDLPNRRGYFFDIEIWPEEVFYITAVLIIAAYGLFLFTSIFGRIWCGYTCPHTVFVDIFVKVEAFFQGDRNARILADTSPMSFQVFIKKALTHFVWAILGFLFASGWVCYFYNAPEFLHDVIYWELSSSSKFWLLGLSFATYLLGGFMREKVCLYMCPYGRFQSAMLDKESLVVTYHNWRGEPKADKDITTVSGTIGDCINCYKCVNVCPMGIDIRDGMQMQCIGCGLCIDACDSVMTKLAKPLGLISYASINSTEKLKKGLKHKLNIIRPKVLIYFSMIIVIASVMVKTLMSKPMFILSVERDRGPLFTITPDGAVRNSYNFYVANKALTQKKLCIQVEGIEDMAMIKADTINSDHEYHQNFCALFDADSEMRFNVFVKIADYSSGIYEKKITFTMTDAEVNRQNKVESTFVFGKI